MPSALRKSTKACDKCMSRAFGVFVRYLGCHEWKEQLRMCWAVVGGKGNVVCRSTSVMSEVADCFQRTVRRRYVVCFLVREADLGEVVGLEQDFRLKLKPCQHFLPRKGAKQLCRWILILPILRRIRVLSVAAAYDSGFAEHSAGTFRFLVFSPESSIRAFQ